MDKLERLAYWKSLADWKSSVPDAARAEEPDLAAYLDAKVWKDEDDLYCYFGLFQPDGKGVERVFAGVVGGDEILHRLLAVYEFSENFVVRRPLPATPEKLVDLTTQHLDNVRQIAAGCRDAGDQEAELLRLLSPAPRIEIIRAQPPARSPTDFDFPESDVYEVTGQWFRDLVPIQSDALLLREAFYSIACDYKIAHHLLWPLYRHSTQIDEPFAPYVELWTHGALPFFERPGLVNVYVAGNT